MAPMALKCSIVANFWPREKAKRKVWPGQGQDKTRTRPGQARPRPGQARPGQARPDQDKARPRPDQARPGQAKPGQARLGQARPGMVSRPVRDVELGTM